MSLACCFTDDETPYCPYRRHETSPMCLKHTEETCRRAILDGGLPADCFSALVKFTDNIIHMKRIARDYEMSKWIQRGRDEREAREEDRLLFDCVVYYVRLTGDRIKIGWTSNLEKRLATYRSRPDDLLATEPGGQAREHHRHKQFAHLRIGRSEDFRSGPDLLAHIESLKAAA